jgi:hypothetical protein
MGERNKRLLPTALLVIALSSVVSSCSGDSSDKGTITISVQEWSGAEGYRLLAGVWSETDFVGGAFWTHIDNDPFSGADVVHPPNDADNGDYETWGEGDYLWDQTARLEPGTYRIEFWANPGELAPYGSHIPAGTIERECYVDVEVSAGEAALVVISEIPREHEPCPQAAP